MIVLNAYEKLEDMAAENDVEIMPHHFESDRIKGLYCDQVIALSNTLRTYPEKPAFSQKNLDITILLPGTLLIPQTCRIKSRKCEPECGRMIVRSA